jgi:hypothetical protein
VIDKLQNLKELVVKSVIDGTSRMSYVNALQAAIEIIEKHEKSQSN